MASVADVVDGHGVGLFIRETRTGHIPFFHGFGIAAGQADYAAHYQTVDPRMAYALAHPQVAVHYDRLAIDERAMDRHEFYDWLLKVGGFRHFMGLRLDLDHSRSAFLAVNWRVPHGHAEPADLERLRRIGRHVLQALRVAERLKTVPSPVTGGLEILDRIRHGIFLIDRRGHCLHMNSAATQVLNRRDGLIMDGGALLACHGPTRPRLDDLIAGVVGRRERPEGDVLVLPRATGARPYQVVVAPLPGRHLDLPVRDVAAIGPVAAVFVTDPEDDAELATETLSRLFGLTPKQAEVCALLAQGLTLKDIADRLSIARSTARLHLEHIFRKTGVGRQADLVRLVLGSPITLFGTDGAPPYADVAE
ncbi:MAG: helix-turn-helix transcriptional regulator [Rhodobacterales bacterium]|nr:helix-turn-helix transcriptional regulator [Rhodobacterales bacterium]